MVNSLVIQFAKAPALGCVKTRLQPALGEQGCLALHESLVRHTFASLWQNPNWDYQLWMTEGNRVFFQSLFNEYGVIEAEQILKVQQGGCLGERMATAVTQNLCRYDKVVVVGSDCPAIDTNYVAQALSALNTDSPVVIGPALDGGYGLIGFTDFFDGVFQGIPWGTERVLASTRQKLDQMGWCWQELEVIQDIDRPQDLQYLAGFPELERFNRGGV